MAALTASLLMLDSHQCSVAGTSGSTTMQPSSATKGRHPAHQSGSTAMAEASASCGNASPRSEATHSVRASNAPTVLVTCATRRLLWVCAMGAL